MAGIGRWLAPCVRGLMAAACFGLGMGCDGADHNPGSSQGGVAGSGGGSAAGSPDGGDESASAGSDAGNGVGGTAGSVTNGGVGGGGGGGAGAAGAAGGPSSIKLSGAEAMLLFEQSPHCSSVNEEFHLEGNVEGKAVKDDRSQGMLHGGYANGVHGSFDSPLGSPDLAPGEVELHFKWTIMLALGEASTMQSGVLVSPVTGKPLCITSGVVGLVGSGAEQQALKFRIDGARAGADCSGEPVALELRGCMN